MIKSIPRALAQIKFPAVAGNQLVLCDRSLRDDRRSIGIAFELVRSLELFRTAAFEKYRHFIVNQCKESVAVAGSRHDGRVARRAAMSRIHRGGKLMAGRNNHHESDRSDRVEQIDQSSRVDLRSDRAMRVWARHRLRELAESGKLGLSTGSAPLRVSASASAAR
ncbi:hypothetical protein ACTZWT_23550 [Rhodopseudomonas sp. NSM]|uniref:hypothetical protein n=1 Tax=Rhodopseudomonas sp. NSM TaxID=3457630 RepID=UPI004035263A